MPARTGQMLLGAALVATLLALSGGRVGPIRAQDGNTPEEAILITGPLSGSAAPQSTVWYRYYYGTPGQVAVISLSSSYLFPPAVPNVALEIYTGAPPSLVRIGFGTGVPGSGLLSYNLSGPAAAYYYVAVVNNASEPTATLSFTIAAAPIVPTPTPSVSPTVPTLEPTATPSGATTPTPTISTPGVPTATPTPGTPGVATPTPTFGLPGEATATPTPTISPGLLTPTPTATSTPPAAPPAGPAPRDERYFAPTGFRIDHDRFWEYFVLRGQVRTFGYPVSRTVRFLGFTTQFFQRAVMQLGPDNSVRLLNLLDPGLMPYTRINGSTYPAPDPAIAAAAPQPDSPGYDRAIIDYVRAIAVDEFAGAPVDFFATFMTTITCADAFPGQLCRTDLIPLLNLEIWGSVTSRPMRDPNNPGFIYQRFQRGIMHYDDSRKITQGVLLADYLKAIITGRNLPLDLEEDARSSRFYRQYCPGQPGWLCRPAELEETDLTLAFETQ